MRGADTFTESLFSVRKLDDFVPTSHPLRSIRYDAGATKFLEAHHRFDDPFDGTFANSCSDGTVMGVSRLALIASSAAKLAPPSASLSLSTQNRRAPYCASGQRSPAEFE